MIPFPATECVNQFQYQADRLGVEIRWTKKSMQQLDAAYHAFPGKPGLILLYDRKPRPTAKQICTLLSHEMVHVLQHWKGELKSLPPLGWPRDSVPSGRNLSVQEEEAYTAQKRPLKVLKAIIQLTPVSQWD